MDTKKTIAWCLALLAGAALLGTGCDSGSQRIAALKQAAADEDKRAGLARLEQAYQSAKYHRGKVEDAAALLASAPHNASAIAYAGELAARVGFQTEVIMSVARSAAQARLELPEFRQLAELAVRKLSDTAKVEDLAAEAARLDSLEGEPALRDKLAALAATADCATVEEAIVRVDEMLAKIKDAGN